VIEDLWLHGGESAVRMRGRATTGMPEFISAITSRLLVGRIEPDDDGGLPGYLFRTIDRVQVISGAVVIAKKGAAAEMPLWDRVIPVIEASNQPESWYHLSSYIMQKRGPLDIAVAAMRNAVARDPNNPGYRMRLADCLDRTGFLEEAISHAEAAVRLAGDGGAAGPYPKFLDALIRKSQRDRA
jgi:tetratricopeptide (TPR) repeat protein